MRRWHAEQAIMQRRWRLRAYGSRGDGRQTGIQGWWRPFDPERDWYPVRRNANEDELGRWPLTPLPKAEQWAYVMFRVLGGTLPRTYVWPGPHTAAVSSEVWGYGRYRKSRPYARRCRRNCRCRDDRSVGYARGRRRQAAIRDSAA